VKRDRRIGTLKGALFSSVKRMPGKPSKEREKGPVNNASAYARQLTCKFW